MSNTGFEMDDGNSNEPGGTSMAEWNGPELRYDLAFPVLTEDMVQRLKAYGQEESFSGDVTLYTHGDRQIDMFVVLDGGVDVYLPVQNGESKVYGRYRKFAFTGELNLLNSQRVVVEARTVAGSCAFPATNSSA